MRFFYFIINLFITADRWIKFNDKLDIIIDSWVHQETKAKIHPNTKLYELSVFNFKLIYTDNNQGKALRDFLMRKHQIDDENVDYIFSRLQDLYIYICTVFPEWFIHYQYKSHIDTLRSLSYGVDDSIAEAFPFGWLLMKMQQKLRYNIIISKKIS